MSPRVKRIGPVDGLSAARKDIIQAHIIQVTDAF